MTMTKEKQELIEKLNHLDKQEEDIRLFDTFIARLHLATGVAIEELKRQFANVDLSIIQTLKYKAEELEYVTRRNMDLERECGNLRQSHELCSCETRGL